MASASGCIPVSAAFKIISCKQVYVKVALASERAFNFFVPVNNERSKFNSLNAERIIYKPFRIAGPDLIFYQVFPWYADEGSIVFVKQFHSVQQRMADK